MAKTKWTPEEDRRLLTFLDEMKHVDCVGLMAHMNQHFSTPPDGVVDNLYSTSDVQKRIFELLRPRNCYLLSPVPVREAQYADLYKPSNKPNAAQSDSIPANSIERKPGHNENPSGLQRMHNCTKEQPAQLEQYGEPELYADLFPVPSEKFDTLKSDGSNTEYKLRLQQEESEVNGMEDLLSKEIQWEELGFISDRDVASTAAWKKC